MYRDFGRAILCIELSMIVSIAKWYRDYTLSGPVFPVWTLAGVSIGRAEAFEIPI